MWRRQSGGGGGEELAVVKHSWGAGADRQVALLTESWWWRKRAGGGTLVMVDKVAASLTWTGADFLPAADFGCYIAISEFGSKWGDCLSDGRGPPRSL